MKIVLHYCSKNNEWSPNSEEYQAAPETEFVFLVNILYRLNISTQRSSIDYIKALGDLPVLLINGYTISRANIFDTFSTILEKSIENSVDLEIKGTIYRNLLPFIEYFSFAEWTSAVSLLNIDYSIFNIYHLINKYRNIKDKYQRYSNPNEIYELGTDGVKKIMGIVAQRQKVKALNTSRTIDEEQSNVELIDILLICYLKTVLRIFTVLEAKTTYPPLSTEHKVAINNYYEAVHSLVMRKNSFQIAASMDSTMQESLHNMKLFA